MGVAAKTHRSCVVITQKLLQLGDGGFGGGNKEELVDEEKVKANAEAHWKWVETWLHLVYVDAFLHGYKHGEENIKEELFSGRGHGIQKFRSKQRRISGHQENSGYSSQY